MQYVPEEYTRHYIVQALFKLMSEYNYEKISVKDIAEKAGVGRATFYRHFKRKEDIILFYFEHYTSYSFISSTTRRNLFFLSAFILGVRKIT